MYYKKSNIKKVYPANKKRFNISTVNPVRKHKTIYYIKDYNYNHNLSTNQVYIPNNQIYKSPTNYIRNINNKNYISKTDKKTINYKPYKYTTKAKLGRQYSFGEIIDEKNNYILYCSGLGSQVEEDKDKDINSQIVYTDPVSQINYSQVNFNEKEINEKETIDATSANYKYKEIKNFRENFPEIKSSITHNIYNTPLRLGTMKRVNFSNNKIFGSRPRSEIMSSYLNSSKKINKSRSAFLDKLIEIKKNKSNNNTIFTDKTRFKTPKVYKKVVSQSHYGNTEKRVETYKKSTKDCDYLIKVTTTSTELPGQDTDEGICVKNKKYFNVYDSKAKYHNNCLNNVNGAKKIKLVKAFHIKQREKRIEEINCPIHGKSTWICTKVE